MTRPPDVGFLPGSAQPDEALRYADLDQMATQGGSAHLYGSRWRGLVAHLYLRPDTLQSHPRVTLARQGSEIVAELTRYSYEEHLRYAPTTAQQVRHYLGWRSLRPSLVETLRRARGIELGRIDAGGFHVSSIAVDPRFRGRGIGSALLLHTERSARAAGAGHVSLDVSRENPGAIALYHRHGFRRVESRSRAVLRMRKDLAPEAATRGSG